MFTKRFKNFSTNFTDLFCYIANKGMKTAIYVFEVFYKNVACKISLKVTKDHKFIWTTPIIRLCNWKLPFFNSLTTLWAKLHCFHHFTDTMKMQCLLQLLIAQILKVCSYYFYLWVLCWLFKFAIFEHP